MTMREIAAEVGVTAGTVCKDITTLKRQWLKESVEAINLIKARELAELGEMEREASSLFAVASRWRTGPDGVPERLPNHSRAQGWMEKRLRIKELRAKLCGLNAPEELEVGVNRKRIVLREVPEADLDSADMAGASTNAPV